MRFPEENFDRGAAARMTAATLSFLDELGPSGRLLNAAAGEASLEGTATPDDLQPWMVLRIKAHRARIDAAAMRYAFGRPNLPARRAPTDKGGGLRAVRRRGGAGGEQYIRGLGWGVAMGEVGSGEE